MTILEELIREDFGLDTRSRRYYKGKKHDSLVYDSELDIFYWNSRGIYGDAMDYLIRVRGYSKKKAEKFISMMVKEQNYKEVGRVLLEERPDIKVADLFHKFLLEDGDYSYFTRRGIKFNAILEYKLGKLRDRRVKFYTVPIINNSRLENIQVRSEVDKNLGRKIIYKIYKIGRPAILHRFLVNIREEIFVVEGILDSILLAQLGFYTLSSDSGLNFYFSLPIGRTYYIIQDNDKAGMSMVLRWMKKFGREKIRFFNWKKFDWAQDKEDIISTFQKFKDYNLLVDLFSNKDNYT